MILLAEDILARLISKQPTSVIRAGDGEGLVLNSERGQAEYNKCLKAVIERQVGYQPSPTEVGEIRSNLIAAYNGADVIGLPRHSNLVELNIDWREVAAAVRRYCITEDKPTCSMNVHYDFLSLGYYDVLISYYSKLHYIGCRDLRAALLGRHAHLDEVHGFHTAPEVKFTSGYVGDKHYPDQFNKVKDWMTSVTPKSQLLLVGAGVIGKIYCNWWRDMGGVAMDIGSVMDEWAGAVTRGPERGLDKIDLTSKYIL